jgi:hypothetical protein
VYAASSAADAIAPDGLLFDRVGCQNSGSAWKSGFPAREPIFDTPQDIYLTALGALLTIVYMIGLIFGGVAWSGR